VRLVSLLPRHKPSAFTGVEVVLVLLVLVLLVLPKPTPLVLVKPLVLLLVSTVRVTVLLLPAVPVVVLVVVLPNVEPLPPQADTPSITPSERAIARIFMSRPKICDSSEPIP
jgi:hypothetical protein